VEHFAAWGGVPRYWELATEVKGGILERLEALALDPLGPLHRDPDLLLLEEIPSALEVRPVLDAIGEGRIACPRSPDAWSAGHFAIPPP
jgi:hypothetical protein